MSRIAIDVLQHFSSQGAFPGRGTQRREKPGRRAVGRVLRPIPGHSGAEVPLRVSSLRQGAESLPPCDAWSSMRTPPSRLSVAVPEEGPGESQRPGRGPMAMQLLRRRGTGGSRVPLAQDLHPYKRVAEGLEASPAPSPQVSVLLRRLPAPPWTKLRSPARAVARGSHFTFLNLNFLCAI